MALFTFFAVVALAAGRADGVFISPRHSQVEMKGDWYPEIQRAGKETRCHWMSGAVGESATLKFEGTSVAVSTRTGARVTWNVEERDAHQLARAARALRRAAGRTPARADQPCRVRGRRRCTSRTLAGGGDSCGEESPRRAARTGTRQRRRRGGYARRLRPGQAAEGRGARLLPRIAGTRVRRAQAAADPVRGGRAGADTFRSVEDRVLLVARRLRVGRGDQGVRPGASRKAAARPLLRGRLLHPRSGPVVRREDDLVLHAPTQVAVLAHLPDERGRHGTRGADERLLPQHVPGAAP